jgi:hypothetical protein
MPETESALRALIDRHRGDIGHGGYPPEVRVRVSAYVRPYRQQGIPWSVLSEALGVSGTTLSNWLKQSDTDVPAFLPVPIASPPPQRPPPARTFSLRSQRVAVRWPHHRRHHRADGLRVMIDLTRARLFLYTQPADLRKGFSGLYAIARTHIADPVDGDIFLFVNRRRTLLKALHWDGTE